MSPEKWSIITAPNEVVSHGQLIGIMAAGCFIYLGDRGGLPSDAAFRRAAMDWNSAILQLRGEELLPRESRAVALMILFLALSTGYVGATDDGEANLCIHREMPRDGLQLPDPLRVKVRAVGVEAPSGRWTVNARWERVEIRVRFSSTGIIDGFETDFGRGS